QIVSIDCIETGMLYTCRETEAFITLCRERDLYSIEEIEADFQADTEYWTCRSCGSRFLWGWSDDEIRIDRQYLKAVQITIDDTGARAAK
ncbi:MAG: hypothetical protein GWO41_08120, partial [candidate division Zixibacteria bacterium]|nr:hypothetical protein [Phycisphaerae bacterium]NIT52688.1 hypothetical protein [candidate division Zixibacteria bacterium]NIW40880.1 hypothetical protein [candidate division Zixibacteria bacterium]NIX59279.1 hypothetical protein [candidate division Zixibacteria bacterium]